MSDRRDQERASSIETAVAPRNFTITPAERVRAIAGGPPAWVLRRRRIEDIEAALFTQLAETAAKRGAWPTGLSMLQERTLTEINRLVDANNRYYPIEANLPIDPRTGRMMDHGRPWRPLPVRTAGDLLVRARAVVDSESCDE